jgi:hypothetical protein
MTTAKAHASHAHHAHDLYAGMSEAAKGVAKTFLDSFAKLSGEDKAAVLQAISPACATEAKREMGA